mmetsp:Transcript_23029/g.34297  ORF Transcript_23029/g.34297 Transcript_23029/m.34297 type:complete len:196 (+) Transcript_23029:26-613(+)
MWQIVRVVHTISSTWRGFNQYSLEELCKAVRVDIRVAKIMLTVRMQQPYAALYKHYEETVENDAESTNNDDSKYHEGTTKSDEKSIIRDRKRQIENRKPNTGQGRNKSEGKHSMYSFKKNKFLYEETDGTLPAGWRIDRVKRLSSNHVDRYWYTKTGKKLRSRVEVTMFLKLIEMCGGDEEAAWEKYPGSRKKPK